MLSPGRQAFQLGMYADQTERKNADEAEYAGSDHRAQHGFFAGDEAAIGQHGIMERVGKHLQQRDENQVNARAHAEITDGE